jgi:hypothetical protein
MEQSVSIFSHLFASSKSTGLSSSVFIKKGTAWKQRCYGVQEHFADAKLPRCLLLARAWRNLTHVVICKSLMRKVSSSTMFPADNHIARVYNITTWHGLVVTQAGAQTQIEPHVLFSELEQQLPKQHVCRLGCQIWSARGARS